MMKRRAAAGLMRWAIFALNCILCGAASAADEITVAVTLSETDVHKEADAASPVFATVPKDMKLIVKGRTSGWIMISGPNQRDAWVDERSVRVESKLLKQKRETASAASSEQAAESWSVRSTPPSIEDLTSRIEKLEQRMAEMERQAAER